MEARGLLQLQPEATRVLDCSSAGGGSHPGKVGAGNDRDDIYSACQRVSGSANPLFDSGKEAAGVQAVNKGVIELPATGIMPFFSLPQVRAGTARRRNTPRGDGAEMQPRQAAGAEEILAVDDKRRRRGMFRRFNVRRGGMAEGGKIGGVVAPDLAKAFLGGHHRRHYRQLVIFDNIVAQQPLFQLRHPVRRATRRRAPAGKRDAAIFAHSYSRCASTGTQRLKLGLAKPR